MKLYFRRGAEASAKAAKTQSDAMPHGSERILVVEDNDGVRDLVCEQVRSLGYEVSEANSADAALVRLQDGTMVDLVLTDVVMPGRLNGKGLADEVDRLWPGTPVVFMSGYAETALLHDGRLDDGVRLLSKPFRKADLARVLREALEERVVILMKSKAAAA